jgi:hypothetical protein
LGFYFILLRTLYQCPNKQEAPQQKNARRLLSLSEGMWIVCPEFSIAVQSFEQSLKTSV